MSAGCWLGSRARGSRKRKVDIGGADLGSWIGEVALEGDFVSVVFGMGVLNFTGGILGVNGRTQWEDSVIEECLFGG